MDGKYVQNAGRIRQIAWAVTAVFAGVIAYTTLSPITQLPGVPANDKVMHLLGFGALALPLSFAYPARGLAVFTAAVAFGGAIELIQPYTGRTAEWLDLVADAAGALIGVLVGIWGAKIWRGFSAT